MNEPRQTVTGLEHELQALPRRIQEAATDGDREAWLSLSMRRDAIAEHLRRRRAEPIKEAIERLEAERDRLAEDERRARKEPPPEVPPHLRGAQTPSGMKVARIAQLAQSGSQVGAELRARKAELAEVLDEEK